MIENDTLVKHKILGYEGLIDGQTSLKMLFTGERGVAFQYRIKVLGLDKRFIAPEEDLVLGNKDKEKEMQSKFKKAPGSKKSKGRVGIFCACSSTGKGPITSTS